MRTASFLLLASLVASLPWAGATGDVAGPRIGEIVADPKWDWNGDGRITTSDEFVEIQAGDAAVDLHGWTLYLEDTTPDDVVLAGILEPYGRIAIVNPPGGLNNDGVVRLSDAEGLERHRVSEPVSFIIF